MLRINNCLKLEVSLYHWPPVWLFWNQLYDNWQFSFYLQNRLIQTSQTGGQWYIDTFLFSIPLTHCLMQLFIFIITQWTNLLIQIFFDYYSF